MAQNSFRRHASLEDITNEHLYLCHFGWHKCDPGYIFGPVIRDFYLIHLVTEGKGTYFARGNRYEVQAGQSFIIYPGETTSYQADPDDPWTYYYFSLNGSLSQSLLDMTNFRNNQMVTEVSTAPLVKIIQNAMKRIDEYPNKLLYGVSVLMTLINVYAQEAEVDPAVVKVSSYVTQAKDYIDFNYSDRLSIAQIAAYLNVSRSHLYKIFKKETGISPMEYLSQCRVRLAAKMLEETDMSTHEIASAVGFDTYSAFFRAFKLAYGYSAIQHRELTRTGEQKYLPESLPPD